jgi:hypothetical protein
MSTALYAARCIASHGHHLCKSSQKEGRVLGSTCAYNCIQSTQHPTFYDTFRIRDKDVLVKYVYGRWTDYIREA